jgi:hypothetical protein
MKPTNIFSHTHFFSQHLNGTINPTIFFFQLMIRFRLVERVKVYGFCRRKMSGGSIEWRENRFKETATPTSGLLFIGQLLGRAQSKQKKVGRGGRMWIFLLVIIRNCVKSWPYSADAMDIMDVVQRLKKGNNQLLRWVIDNFVYSFFSFGCIVQNGDFSQELIHRSRKMTSFLYYTRSCRCFQQSHAAMIRTRMFQLNLRVRCQFQQSKRFSPVFFLVYVILKLNYFYYDRLSFLVIFLFFPPHSVTTTNDEAVSSSRTKIN